MNQNETYMNRFVGSRWWYWPAIATASAMTIMALIYLTSVSYLGTNIALMLGKLI